MKTILAIALAFGLVGCVDETTPEGIDSIEEEFDDLGPDTHKSDVDETEPTDEEQPLDFTQEPQAQLLENGDPREATVTEPAREEAQRLVETGARPALESRTPAPRL